MLNVDELESKHKKYKLKSYTPYLAITLGVSAAILSISFFIIYDFNAKTAIATATETEQKLTSQSSIKDIKPDVVSKKEEENLKQEVADIIVVKEKDEEIKKEEKEKPMAQDTKEKVLLSPSLNFIKRLEFETAPLSKKEDSVKAAGVIEKKVEKPIKKSSESVKQESKKEEIVLPVVEEVKESIVIAQKPTVAKPASNTSIIDIKRRDDEEDIKHVIKRFNVNHNPALSLFAAKKYYQLGDYEQAYNYSLITNDINNNIEASWLIFSKSLVKLGKKDKAIETLKKYINYSGSSQARQLLDDIISGKFK